MSERGVFAVDRGIFEHQKFRDDKREFSRLEAWLWLLSSAAWKPHARRVSGKDFHLKRGQLVASTRYMAERWRWSEARVRRFLECLKTDADGDAEIDVSADAGVTVVTIRKYNVYQRVSLPSDAVTDAAADAHSDAVATQERRNKEDKEDKEDKEEEEDHRSGRGPDAGSPRAPCDDGTETPISPGAAAKPDRVRKSTAPPASPAGFDDFYALYPRKEGKQDAKKAFVAVLKSGSIDLPTLIERTRAYAAATNWHALPQEERRYIPHPARWLRAGRYDDEPMGAGAPTVVSNGTSRSNSVVQAARRLAERFEREFGGSSFMQAADDLWSPSFDGPSRVVGRPRYGGSLIATIDRALAESIEADARAAEAANTVLCLPKPKGAA